MLGAVAGSGTVASVGKSLTQRVHVLTDTPFFFYSGL